MFSDFFNRLNDRERLFVTAGIGLLVFLFVYLVFSKIYQFRNDLTEKLNTTRSQFGQLDRVIKDYNYYKNLKSGGSEDDVSQMYSKLDQILVRYNLKEKVSTMKDSQAVIRKEYNKISIDVSLKSVILNDVFKLIYDIEKNKQMNGKVDLLSFQKPYADREIFDVNLRISSYNRNSSAKKGVNSNAKSEDL